MFFLFCSLPSVGRGPFRVAPGSHIDTNRFCINVNVELIASRTEISLQSTPDPGGPRLQAFNLPPSYGRYGRLPQLRFFPDGANLRVLRPVRRRWPALRRSALATAGLAAATVLRRARLPRAQRQRAGGH